MKTDMKRILLVSILILGLILLMARIITVFIGTTLSTSILVQGLLLPVAIIVLLIVVLIGRFKKEKKKGMLHQSAIDKVNHKTEEPIMGSTDRQVFFRKKNIWQMVLILVIVYAISSVNVLVLFLTILPYLHGAFFKINVLIYFSEISFGLAVFLSIYHLYTMFHTKKRQNDIDGTEVIR